MRKKILDIGKYFLPLIVVALFVGAVKIGQIPIATTLNSSVYLLGHNSTATAPGGDSLYWYGMFGGSGGDTVYRRHFLFYF